MTKHFYILALLIPLSTSAAAGSIRIVTSIKPIHSLVSGITQGITEPELLMSSRQSPHHYSLRPSERKMLADADLIFWIGPGMESFMSRILTSLQNKNNAISLIQSPKLTLLPARSIEGSHKHHDLNGNHSKTDPHIWLNTYNLDILVDTITQHIISIDPKNKQQYQINSKQLHEQIRLLRKTLKHSLSKVKKSFITYHDGYQYFENEFNLNNEGFVSSSELQPSARRINELKKLIKTKNITCIFYDAPIQPQAIKLLLTDGNTKAYMLDPLGINIPASKKLWFDVMNLTGKQFINCQHGL